MRIALALAIILFATPALAAGSDNRSYTGGRFMMDIAGHNEGQVQPIEGGSATGGQVTEKPGTANPAPAPARNSLPQQATQPRGLGAAQQVRTPAQPAGGLGTQCAKPPCPAAVQPTRPVPVKPCVEETTDTSNTDNEKKKTKCPK